MKRTALIFFLLFALLLTACASGAGGGKEASSETAAPESSAPEEKQEDFDNHFGMSYDALIETEDAYYYNSVNGYYIYYFDKASGERGVLCAKPECIHDEIEQNESCSGFAYTLGKSLNLWDGRLHFVAHSMSDRCFALYSIGLDGSDRTKDVLLDTSDMDGLGNPQRFEYHRGKLYGWSQFDRVIDGVPMFETSVMSFDPETGGMQLIFRCYESDIPFMEPVLFFYGQYVYFVLEGSSSGPDGSGFSVIELRRWNIETEELEDVFITREEEPARFGRIWVENEDLIYYIPGGGVHESNAVVYAIADGKLERLFEFDDFYAVFPLCYGAAQVNPFKGTADVRRWDGSVVFQGELDVDFTEEIGPGYHTKLIGSVYGDEDEFYAVFVVQGEDGQEGNCLVKYDLSAERPEATVLAFSRWW